MELEREPCPSVTEVPLREWEWEVLASWYARAPRACAALAASATNGLSEAVRRACHEADPIAARLLASTPSLTLGQALIQCTAPPVDKHRTGRDA